MSYLTSINILVFIDSLTSRHLVVKTTNLRTLIRMVAGVWFHYLLIYRGVTVYMSIQAKPLHTTAKLLESGGLGVSRNYPLNIWIQ